MKEGELCPANSVLALRSQRRSFCIMLCNTCFANELSVVKSISSTSVNRQTVAKTSKTADSTHQANRRQPTMIDYAMKGITEQGA